MAMATLQQPSPCRLGRQTKGMDHKKSDRKKRRLPMREANFEMPKRGRPDGAFEGVYKRQSTARHQLLRNPLSAESLQISLEHFSSQELLQDEVRRQTRHCDQPIMMRGTSVLSPSECKVDPIKANSFVYRADIDPAISKLEKEHANFGFQRPRISRYLESVIGYLKESDEQQLVQCKSNLMRCTKVEDSLRKKLKAIALEMNALQGNVCEDTLVHTDFSCHKGHVLFRCLGNLQSRLRIAIRERKVGQQKVSRAAFRLSQSTFYSKRLVSLKQKTLAKKNILLDGNRKGQMGFRSVPAMGEPCDMVCDS